MKKKYNNAKTVYDKVKEKLFYWMKKRDLYFIMGTHFVYGTWLIISLIYPKYYGEALDKWL